jgi:putative Mg2+ transporter-C (MgtC) family protein
MGSWFAAHQLELSILARVGIAMLLGAAVGFERETKDKPAGLRTNMLIAGSAALLLSLGTIIAGSKQLQLPPEAMGVDPTRIIHAIIVGVSFIGAGTILKSPGEHTISYLTTAATLLFSAGAGMCIALRLYPLAAGVTIIGVIINTIVRRLSQ